jgi:hypothetical protein
MHQKDSIIIISKEIFAYQYDLCFIDDNFISYNYAFKFKQHTMICKSQ